MRHTVFFALCIAFATYASASADVDIEVDQTNIDSIFGEHVVVKGTCSQFTRKPDVLYFAKYPACYKLILRVGAAEGKQLNMQETRH